MSFKGTTTETPKHCKGCVYRGNFSAGISICNFAEITGKLRNCSAEECPYYLKKSRKKRKEEEK